MEYGVWREREGEEEREKACWETCSLLHQLRISSNMLVNMKSQQRASEHDHNFNDYVLELKAGVCFKCTSGNNMILGLIVTEIFKPFGETHLTGDYIQ